MSVGHAVLGVLARGDRYGYALRAELEREFGPEWRIDFGQLYRTLGVSEARGWVTARVEPGERGPERKLYSITHTGREELERWLRAPDRDSERGRDSFPVRLRLGLDTDAERAAAIVSGRRDRLETRRTTELTRTEEARRRGDAAAWLIADARARRTDAELAALASSASLLGTPPAAVADPDAALIATGSDDPVLDLLARRVAERHPEMQVSTRAVGSLGGLLALRDRRAHLAGIHLLDADTGEYNVAFVRHLLPEDPTVLLNLALREQGLLVAAGNPKGIAGLGDLTRPGIRFVNRQPGAGTRLFVYQRLRRAGIEPRTIDGYEREVPTHDAVAAAIAAGTADIGPGIRAAAEAWGLDFLPLGYERYDLAIPRRVFDSARLAPLLEALSASEFRRAAGAFAGYDFSRSSEIVADLT